jgi:hypothetical protein
MPPPPPLPPSEGPIDRPKAVDSAFHAILAAIVISSLGTVFTVLLDKTQLTAMVNDMMADLPEGQTGPSDAPGAVSVAGTVGAFQVILGFSIAIFAGLMLLFAIKMRTGRNWARILLTVYTGIGVWSFLSAMASVGAELGLMWSLAEVAFGVTAVVYMFRPESTRYFAEHKQRRMQARQRP